MPHPYLAATASPRVLAHRGLVTSGAAAQRVVENTRAAFDAAVAAGAVYLESDLRVTSDGEVVLFHDADLARVLGDPRPVAQVSAGELAELLRDRGGLLTLSEALERFPQSYLNIDVKVGEAADPAGRLLAPHAERVLATSFSDRIRAAALQAAERAGGARPATSAGRGALIRILAALATRSRRATSHALSGLDALQIPERQGRVPVLSRRLIDAAHDAGVEVHVWTVNDPARMDRLLALGVDGIITDRADLALERVAR